MKTIIFSILTILALQASSQCDTVVIGPAAQRGNIVNPVHHGLLTFWLCAGDSIITDGGGSHDLFFDYNSYGKLFSSSCKIYVRSGSYVEIDWGSSDNSILVEHGATIVDHPSNTGNYITYVPCIYFETSTNPNPPCRSVTSTSELTYTFDRTTNLLTLPFQNNCTIVNQVGQVVAKYTNQQYIQLPQTNQVVIVLVDNYKPIKIVPSR
jgi:hypothetical protein